MVTILLPTIDRPHMLRTALTSIAAQTARDRIARVIVSENTGGRHATAVCREFENRLPIDYRTQSKVLTPLEHDRLLATQVPDDGFGAILHDDDWWAPEHLAQSLARFAEHPDAVASYSGFFTVESESAPLVCDTNLMFWFGAGFPAVDRSWLLGSEAILLSCLWGTPGRFTALVARGDCYKRAAVVYEMGNPFDNDRLLTLEFVKSGPIVFGPLPTAFIRCHPSQGGNRFTSTQQQAFLRSTVERIAAQAVAANLDLRALVASRLATCPPSSRPTLLHALAQPWCIDPLRACGAAPKELVAGAKLSDQLPSKNVNYYLGQLLPPFFTDWLKRACSR